MWPPITAFYLFLHLTLLCANFLKVSRATVACEFYDTTDYSNFSRELNSWLYRTNYYYYTRFTALFPVLPRWASTRKVKPIWILLKQETLSGSGISWAICKSAPRPRQITTPAPHHSLFTGRMPFLPPNQQRQNTEGSGHSTARNQIKTESKKHET